MRASVIIRTKDEARRLRLTLTSLSAQKSPAQVVVVNDGSSDDTRDVLREARIASTRERRAHERARAFCGIECGCTRRDRRPPDLSGRRHACRPTASSNGTLRCMQRRTWPDEVKRSTCARRVLLRDPETLEPWPGEEHTLAERPHNELERMRITRERSCTTLPRSTARLPGSIPAREHAAFTSSRWTRSTIIRIRAVLWAAASGSNFSVERERFSDAGGFLEELDLNEHRELALRLYARGLRLVPVPGARTYHLIHGETRNPLEERAWEEVFYRAHPVAGREIVTGAVGIARTRLDDTAGRTHPFAPGVRSCSGAAAQMLIAAPSLKTKDCADARGRADAPAVRAGESDRNGRSNAICWTACLRPNRKPAICIVSLLREVEGRRADRSASNVAFAMSSARWRTANGCLSLHDFSRLRRRCAKLERIRRLNLLAVELSHDLDAGVIDFDRQFADIGAQVLETSYRLEGAAAREIAAYVIVKTLLAAGAFDDHVPPETIEQARVMYDRAYQAKGAQS